MKKLFLVLLVISCLFISNVVGAGVVVGADVIVVKSNKQLHNFIFATPTTSSYPVDFTVTGTFKSDNEAGYNIHSRLVTVWFENKFRIDFYHSINEDPQSKSGILTLTLKGEKQIYIGNSTKYLGGYYTCMDMNNPDNEYSSLNGEITFKINNKNKTASIRFKNVRPNFDKPEFLTMDPEKVKVNFPRVYENYNFRESAVIRSADKAKYSMGSVFLVSGVNQNNETENYEPFVHLSGNFSSDPTSYISKINSDDFKADIVFVYKDYILAFDYEADWKTINHDYNHQFLFDYGNAALSGWSDGYSKLCELQKVKIPSETFYMDMFYIDRYSEVYPYDVTMKLINTKTGAKRTYNTWDKDIHRQTLGLYTCVHPTKGLQISFNFYPALLRPDMKEFLSPLLNRAAKGESKNEDKGYTPVIRDYPSDYKR